MRLTRVITVVLFLSLMVLPLMLTTLLIVSKVLVQLKMQEALEQQQLVTLHLSPSEIHWFKKSKELVIGSTLFDVKSIRQTSSGYTVTGLFDHEEAQIKDYLEQLAEEDDENKNQHLKLAFQSWFVEEESNVKRVCFKPVQTDFPLYNENIFETSYPVINPPPEFH